MHQLSDDVNKAIQAYFDNAANGWPKLKIEMLTAIEDAVNLDDNLSGWIGIAGSFWLYWTDDKITYHSKNNWPEIVYVSFIGATDHDQKPGDNFVSDMAAYATYHK